MDKAMAISLGRHGLQMLGGALIARGVVDPGGWDLIAGAITSIATAAWYVVGRAKK